jgi:hypothetical protein
MPPETVEVESNTPSVENFGPQVIIILQLPAPYDQPQIHLPASEIAKPTNPDDSNTTAFADSWMKNIIIKTFRKLELVIEEYDDLSDNDHHLDDLKSLIEYPTTSKKTFEHYFQFSVLLSTGHFIELYTSQVLQRFVDFYTNPPTDRLLVFHLEIVGKARRHLKHLLSITPTIASIANSTTPVAQEKTNTGVTMKTTSNDVSPSPLTIPDQPDDDDKITTDKNNNDADYEEEEEEEEEETVHPSFRSLNGVADPKTPKFTLLHRDRNGKATFTEYQERRKAVVIDRERLANNMKPNLRWNAFERNNSYIKSKQDYVDQYNQENPYPTLAIYSNVSSWTRARFNPDNADLVIDPNTGLFLPWRAERSSTGRMVDCFPVQLNDVFMIRDVYLSTFRGGPSCVGYIQYNPKTIKHFQDAFPCLGSNDIVKFLHWHNDLVDFCSRYGIYCPPAHTLRPGQPLGIWFNDLPNNVQLDVQKHFAKVLTGCLRSKMSVTVRQDHPMIANIVQHGSTNGYQILYLLAEEAGKHPLLVRYPSVPPEPKQTYDTTLEHYVNEWIQYLQYMLLDGTVYCDRYFLQQFQRNLYPAIKQRIGPHLRQEISDIALDLPLPPEFAPDRLVPLLNNIAQYAGFTGLAVKTPRELFQKQAVRSLHHHHDTTTTTRIDYDIDLPAIVAALNNADAMTCFLCTATDHKMAQCPTYQRLSNNPRAVTAILRSLKPQRDRPSGPPRHVRQIADTSSDLLIEIGEGNIIDMEAGEGNISDDDDIIARDNGSPTETDDQAQPDFI